MKLCLILSGPPHSGKTSMVKTVFALLGMEDSVACM